MVIQHMEPNEYLGAKISLPDYLSVINKISFQLLIFFSLSFLFMSFSFAGDVKFTPSVNIKESYSDNILLASKGREESESITEVSPAFSLLMNGNHFNASVNYTMQNLFYKNESKRNTTYNQLAASSTSELVDDYLFFDVSANHSQQVVSADEPIGSNNLAVTNNNSNVSSYSIAPYFRHSFRNILDASLRYSYSEVDYRRDELIDSSQKGYSLDLSSPATTPGYSWGLSYLEQENDYKTGNDSEFKRGSLQLGYRFSSRTHLYASKGKDENTYSVSDNRDISQSSWNVGLDWQPAARDFLSIQYGERFFGHTAKFSWRHSARRLTLNANYEEELSTSALSLLESQQIGSAASQQNQPVETSNSINSQVFVKELATIGVSYNVSKTSLSLSFTNDRRTFQDSADITEAKSVNLSASLRSTPLLTYVFGTRWSRNHTASTEVKSFITNINFAIQRQLASSLQAEFSISHGVRRSSNSASDYDENIVSIGLTKSFN